MSDDPHAHLPDHARTRPHDIAVMMSDGSAAIDFATLEARSDALAGQLAAVGIAAGDHVAILIENRPDFYVAVWGTHRLGLHYTAVNWHLSADEGGYIVRDSGARVLLTSPDRLPLAQEIVQACPGVALWCLDRGGPSGFAPVAAEPLAPVAYVPREGASMLYSSGTTGRPKGIKRRLADTPFGAITPGDQMLRDLYGFDAGTVLLIPAPLYHAAPLNFGATVMRGGGRVVVMPAFDPQAMLDAIARERITAAWMVPTMMIRLLRLPEAARAAADTSSLRHVIHSAAPCPVAVKRAMMDWLGPILYEFYGATEGNGVTAIGPHEWLAHPGSVGRSEAVRIVGEDGGLVPEGEVGLIYFATTMNPFEYHGDPGKTAATRHPLGWTTIGDIGFVDGEGYLFLTDRKDHMIIAGGVNIYPQEAEDVLSTHPLVADVAVIGVPHSVYGEEVKAVVELIDPAGATAQTADVLIEYCRARLAKYKCPRSIDFADALPRTPTGKLVKRTIRARYWPDPVRPH